MSEEHFPAPGKFVWHDLMTTDVERAVAFYQDLLGWGVNDVDMGGFGTYKMINAGGVDQGGIVPLGPGDGHPSHWIAYVLVDDVDAAVERAQQLGGQAPVPATDIPGIGRFAVVLDPAGAAISPFKPATPGPDGDAGPPKPGTFCWHELLALDPEAEGTFFAEIFGWQTEVMDMGEMGPYHLFKRGEQNAAGMLKKPDGSGPAAWLPYVAVEDVDDRAAKVKELGGKVWVEPADIPGVGRFAVTSDPTGAMFALYREGTAG